MQKLETKLLDEIKASLYMLLAALSGVLIVTLFIALRPKPADAELSFMCGNYSPSPNSTAYKHGKELFIANCASCHNKNMHDKLTGPPLEDVEINWAKFPRKDLYNYIRHSQAMTKAKHPRALQLWKAWKPAVMNDFSSLTDQDIDSILYYIEFQKIQSR